MTGIGSSFLPILVFFFGKKNTSNIYFKVLCFEILSVNFLTLLLFLFTNYNQNNLFFWNTFVESILVMFAFKFWSKELNTLNRLSTLLIFVNVAIFGLFYIILDFKFEERLSFYTLVMNILLSFFSIYVVLENYKNSVYDSLLHDKLFVFASGLLLYNGLQVYVSMYDSVIRKDNYQLFLFTWPIVQISGIFYYILLSRVVWISKK
jgi:hypothetical protein